MSIKSLHALILIFFFSISSSFPVSQEHDRVPHIQTPSTSPETPSIFTTIKHYLARIFPFHQPTPFEDISPDIRRNQPADQNWQPDSLSIEEEDAAHQSSNQTNPQQRILFDISNHEQLSPDDLLHIVIFGKKLFQAIEAALTERTKDQSEATHKKDKNSENLASSHESDESIKERHELSTEPLPDVRLALVQAEQLNKRREKERQAKLALLDQEQNNKDTDYTEGPPRSAPSYPARVRLQKSARKKRWTRAT